jgi:hypothetical protein
MTVKLIPLTQIHDCKTDTTNTQIHDCKTDTTNTQIHDCKPDTPNTQIHDCKTDTLTHKYMTVNLPDLLIKS